MTAQRIGEVVGQDVWFCSELTIRGAEIVPPPEPHFTCGFFLFNANWKTTDMQTLVASLIQAGCVSMMFHGARCREAEDIADKVFVEGGYEKDFGGADDTLMTTSSHGETILDAVFDFFCASYPTSGFKNSSFYAIALGSKNENDDLRKLLAEPQRTIQRATSTMPR